jgi:hypothetical protein
MSATFAIVPARAICDASHDEFNVQSAVRVLPVASAKGVTWSDSAGWRERSVCPAYRVAEPGEDTEARLHEARQKATA